MFLLFLKKKYLLLMFVVLIGLGLFSVQSFSGYKEGLVSYYKRGQTDKSFKSWSGRKGLWRQSLKKFKESPFLGYGKAAGVRYGAVIKRATGSHLHNSYFEVLLNSGLLGFIPWLLGLFSLFKKILIDNLFVFGRLKKDMQVLYVEMVAILMFFLIRSLAGTTFVDFDYTYIIYICLIVFSYFLAQAKSQLGTERC